MLSVMPTSVVEAHMPSMPSIKHYSTVEVKEAYEYDYIIFYRWLSPDLYERGRVMARLIAEMIEKKTCRVWLDQHQMTRSTEAREVTKRISQTFLSVSQIIILAAPGDWNRFSNMDDIHRWEWEMSLRSDKQIWLLQYGTPDNAQAATKEQLEAEMSTRCPRLAKLFVGRELHIRSLSMDNIDAVLGEIAEAR